jgi:glycosyltransferase involved in cell wall biosynthesis
MKILLIASAFSHLWGSEPGVGWNWAMEMARTHEVTVLTHGYFRSHLQAWEAEHGEPPFRVVYHDLSPLRDEPDTQYMNSTLHFLRWQWHSRRTVRKLLARERFDLIHHLTLGTVRYPSFLQGLGVPLVAGPLGGGERAPARLYAGLPWKLRLKEFVRDLVIWSTAWDPVIHLTWGRTDLLICRTRESRDALPRHLRKQVLLIQEIGCPPALPAVPETPATPLGTLHALSVGRLLGWKGIHLSLMSLAELKAQGLNVQLTLVGEGDAQGALQALAGRLGIAEQVHWVGKISRDQVMRLYAQADLMLFPSLHDSGGTVVLESISQGCPVVCLDLGGPPHFIDATCGRVVPVDHARQTEVVAALAGTLRELAELSPHQKRALKEGALSRARALSWRHRVEGAYTQIQQRLRLPTS